MSTLRPLSLSLCVAFASLGFSQTPAETSSFGQFVRPQSANPILTPRRFSAFDCPIQKQSVEWDSASTSTPAAVVRNGKVFLLFTAREWKNPKDSDVVMTARIGLAESTDGIHFTRSAQPVLFPAEDAQNEREWQGGCQDPRVVEAKDGTYVMTYSQVQLVLPKEANIDQKAQQAKPQTVIRLAVATSKDLVRWEKQGPAFSEEYPLEAPAGGVVVSRKQGDRLVAAQIGGKYWMYWGRKSLFLASSEDLIHWTPVKKEDGKLREVLSKQPERFDSLSTAAGACALLTDAGIVVLTNGEAVKVPKNKLVEGTWSVGEALFDAVAPERLIRQGGKPLLTPELPYEAVGQNGVGKTIGSGLVWFKNAWYLYYGAAQSRVGVVVADPSGKAVNQPVARKPKLKQEPFALSMESTGYAVLVKGWELIEAPAISGSAQDLCSPQLDTSKWLEAVVPGTVLTTLVTQGIEPDPLFGDNNLRISEKYCRQAYWYRNAFTLPQSTKGRQLQLEFEGINYAAEIWLNGESLGQVTGAFARGRFDISRAAKAEGVNVLLVKVLPPPNPGVPHEQSLWDGAGPNGGQAMMDGPTFGCSMGWDWIPGIRDRCTGIWQNVGIRATDGVQLGDVQVVTNVPSLQRAEVSINVPLKNRSKEHKKGILRGRLGEIAFEQPVSVGPGEQSFQFNPESVAGLAIANPRLWWPNGYGKPELYDLELTFVGQDGVVSDRCKMKVGLREMSYDLGRESAMETMIKVNGQRIFCRGGNWGMDEALKRLDSVRMDAWVRMHRDANLNFIRNWVAQSTSELFFQKCDQYGILVWNDFTLANPGDGPEPADKEVFIQNLEETVLRFRNHPSIALWCARNEGVAPVPLATRMYQSVWKLDNTRIFLPHSAAYGVSGWGPYSMQSPGSYFSMARGHKSELGLPSIPTLASMQAMLDAKDQWPINDTWAYHDFCRKGAMGTDGFLAVIEKSFGAPRDLEDFTRKSALLNYERHRAAYEAWGQRMWRGTSGLLLWMTHCSWPSMVWQLYSHDLEPTSSLFGAQKACEPIHVQMDPRNRNVSVVNMPAKQIPNAKVEALILDVQGNVLHKAEAKVDLAATAVTDCLQLPAAEAEFHFVSLVLRDSEGAELSRNFYWSGKEEKSLQALNAMPKVKLEATASLQKGEGQPRVVVQLHNPSKNIAFMTQLTLRNGSGQRALPVFYSENYLTLLPGETRSVSIDQGSSSHQFKVDVEGWNLPKTSLGVKK